MIGSELAVVAGAVGLGLVHGAEPGHGWPIAATYALDRRNKWLNGFVASALLGIGHLISSLAVVAVFLLARSYFELTQLNEPLTVGPLTIGGPVDVVAGLLLIGLAVREYRHGHEHGQRDDSAHGGHDGHGDDNHGHDGHGDHDHGSHSLHDGHHDHSGHSHHDHSEADLDTRGLSGIVWTAFVLGFAHEEEFEIIGLCVGSTRCVALMVAYATAVLVALVGLTLLLIAGYERYEERMVGIARHFPTISAGILIVLGTGFLLGLL